MKMERFELAMKHLLKMHEKVIDDAIQHHAVNKSFTTYASVEALIAQTKEDAAFVLMHGNIDEEE